MKKYYILTFENTHEAINAEDSAKMLKIKYIIMPTPTYITKSCGICIRIEENELYNVKKLIEMDKIKIKDIFLKDDDGYKSIQSN